MALDRKPFWHYRRYGVEALLAMGKKSEALKYAETSRGLNQPDSTIDQACEEILVYSGLHDEAYRRYGLRAARGNSYLARFRAAAKPYPMVAREDIRDDGLDQIRALLDQTKGAGNAFVRQSLARRL